MYLSQLLLDLRSRRTQRESADPYELHRTVMRAFPETLPADERVLFRREIRPAENAVAVLIQSIYEPDWSWLTGKEAQGYLLGNGRLNPEVKLFTPSVKSGEHLRFRLVANPTVKRDGKRHGLWQEEQQVAWLNRKAQDGGFDVLSVQAQKLGTAQGWTQDRHRLNLFAVQFEGVLKVHDPAILLETIRNGVGSAKGMGFGLLSVARAG